MNVENRADDPNPNPNPNPKKTLRQSLTVTPGTARAWIALKFSGKLDLGMCYNRARFERRGFSSREGNQETVSPPAIISSAQSRSGGKEQGLLVVPVHGSPCNFCERWGRPCSTYLLNLVTAALVDSHMGPIQLRNHRTYVTEWVVGPVGHGATLPSLRC